MYFEVTVKVTDDSGALKSGMTADVDIIVDERSNVLVIPNTALESFRGLVMARVLDENKEPSFKRVELGISDGTFTEVISGLEAGEMVAIPVRTGAATTVPAASEKGAKPNDAIYTRRSYATSGRVRQERVLRWKVDLRSSVSVGDLNMIEVDGLTKSTESATLRFLPYEECLSHWKR